MRDLFWLVRVGGEDVPITGSGSYWIGGESAREHRLKLALRIGEEERQRFDSGFVPVEPPGFPRIDVRISIHGAMFFDTVIDVRAVPFPSHEPSPRTPCGPELTENALECECPECQ